VLDIVAGRNTAERKQPDEREEKQEKNEADPCGSTRRALSSRLHDCHTGRTCGRLRTKIKPPVIDDDIARLDIGRRSRHSLIGVLVATGWLGLVLHGRRVGVLERSHVSKWVLSYWNALLWIGRQVGFLEVDFLALGRRCTLSTFHFTISSPRLV